MSPKILFQTGGLVLRHPSCEQQEADAFYVSVNIMISDNRGLVWRLTLSSELRRIETDQQVFLFRAGAAGVRCKFIGEKKAHRNRQ